MHSRLHLHTLAHLVLWSPWPVVAGMSGGLLASSTVVWFQHGGSAGALFSLLICAITGGLWWMDIGREGTSGELSPLAVDGLQLGMLWFLFSELCFFGAFFWSFFHLALSPAVEVGNTWPPAHLSTVNAFHLPLLNTAVLLSSGATVTVAHHRLVGGRSAESWILWTVLLGLYFTVLQATEYAHTSFSMSDSCFGAIFFVATGFHGTHVLVGATTLAVTLGRLASGVLGPWDHLGVELAIWYWHFVDVIWLILFVVIYWWGGQ